MQKQYRIANFKVLLLSMLGMGILVIVLVYFAQKFSYTVNQTYFLIFGLSLLTLMMFYINLKFTKLVSFNVVKNTININESRNIEIEEGDVIDYNFYLLTHKTMGHLLRINTKNKEYVYWIVWVSLQKITEEEVSNIKNLQKEVTEVLKGKKIKKGIDYCILFVSWLPFILLALGLLTLLFGLFYVFSL
ncbi:hypothetical protein ACM46_18925 [Chryseobacterium angstadtii]|uniref:Uncharacterized protein n=1 Tax=Chryseobacterium angstadtii TaxID=558151 RepID=A0A0J7KSW9_9FLAO|nr:hypothetical protein [Chryseobacterium angstadtii]KMQ60280.1 hypothetical protein ACM46_18925 [Chryseobacterium angstadtii]